MCVLGERAMDGCVCVMGLGLLYQVVPMDWMFWDGFYWGDERGDDENENGRIGYHVSELEK